MSGNTLGIVIPFRIINLKQNYRFLPKYDTVWSGGNSNNHLEKTSSKGCRIETSRERNVEFFRVLFFSFILNEEA
jgi:hypothetical protein